MRKYLAKNIAVDVNSNLDFKKILNKKFRFPKDVKYEISILRKSIDARKKNRLKWNFTLILETNNVLKTQNDLTEYPAKDFTLTPSQKIKSKNPFIIGAGPAGLFAALILVENGFEPYIFEKGEPIDNRIKTVNDFWQKGILNPKSNVQFGEGGAGAFSDGKLTARSRNVYAEKVFRYLIKFGADPSIIYEALPHLGTDGLHKIVINIRKYLISKGTKFFWNHELDDIQLKGNKIDFVKINRVKYSPELIFLAIGNAARNTFKLLSENGIAIQSKPFSVGFRIEHKREFINKELYGAKTDFSKVGEASYRLTSKIGNRGVYSFCMCPGGFVVAASSEKKSVVVNGMSYLKRDNEFSNSAIVCSVGETDFGNQPFSGIEFQKKWENRAFNFEFPYFAPSQKVADFMNNNITQKLPKSSYKPGIYSHNLNEFYTKQIIDSLKIGLKNFDKKIPGFIKNGNLLGVETRTSSPIRIVRDKENLNSLSAKNLFPIGEGAGYAGGIISSASDGVKAASKFLFSK